MPTTAARDDVTLRLLTEGDVAFAHQLNVLAGWNQTERDWRGYLEFAPDGCFAALAGDRPAGTATTIAYGRRFGWIGMVLVAPEFRRGGIGTRLLRHAIAELQRRGVGCIKLDATPMGRPVYVPLGFVDEYELSRYEGVAPPSPAPSRAEAQPLGAADLPSAIAFDAPIFGAERSAVLRSLSARNPELCFLARDDASRVSGYLIAREGRQAVQIGPWLANESAVAARLLHALFARVAGRRVFVDVPHPNAAGRALVEQQGFTIQRGYTRMFLGANRHPGVPERVFGTSSAEKG